MRHDSVPADIPDAVSTARDIHDSVLAWSGGFSRLRTDFSGAAVAAASIAQRFNELRQLPQVWRASGVEVSRLSRGNCDPAYCPSRVARHL